MAHTSNYNHDMAHCGEKHCSLHDLCYRGWLADHYKEYGWKEAFFFQPEPNELGRECPYYLNKENY